MTESQPHPPAPPSTEENGVQGAGAGGGVRVKLPAPRSLTRTQILAALLADATVSAIARDLNLHRSTVQQHRDALVKAGTIVVSGGKHRKGPGYAQEVGMGGAGPDRGPPANPTAPWIATDGSRTFELLRVPTTHPTTMPGFVGTALTGRARDPAKKRRDHRILWTSDGRSFDLLLMESPGAVGHGWSIQLKKIRPAPYLSAIQKEPGEDREVAMDRYASAAVQAWAQLAGVAVSPVARRSRPVSLALPGVVDPAMKVRTHDFDLDGTPEPGTLEVRKESLKAALETLPENLAAIGRQLRNVSDQVSGLRTLVAQEATIAEGIVGVQADQARTVASVLQAITPNRPLSPSAQSFTPGVDYQ